LRIVATVVGNILFDFLSFHASPDAPPITLRQTPAPPQPLAATQASQPPPYASSLVYNATPQASIAPSTACLIRCRLPIFRRQRRRTPRCAAPYDELRRCADAPPRLRRELYLLRRMRRQCTEIKRVVMQEREAAASEIL